MCLSPGPQIMCLERATLRSINRMYVGKINRRVDWWYCTDLYYVFPFNLTWILFVCCFTYKLYFHYHPPLSTRWCTLLRRSTRGLWQVSWNFYQTSPLPCSLLWTTACQGLTFPSLTVLKTSGPALVTTPAPCSSAVLPTGHKTATLQMGEYYSISKYDPRKYLNSITILTYVSISQLAKSLGQAGEIEPETEGILTEYDVDCSEFSDEVLNCLPKNLPWTIPPEEMTKRKDLRWDIFWQIIPDICLWWSKHKWTTWIHQISPDIRMLLNSCIEGPLVIISHSLALYANKHVHNFHLQIQMQEAAIYFVFIVCCKLKEDIRTTQPQSLASYRHAKSTQMFDAFLI